MEHCYRAALWMFFLIGCLHAAPTTEPSIKKSDIELLRQNIACCGNVTFKSPKNVKDLRLTAVLDTIIEELEHARACCECEQLRFDQALDALERFHVPSQENNTPECERKQEGSLKFEVFLKELEDVIDLNSANKSNKRN